MKNVVVVGAGTAGWMTALYINQLIPSASITIIGSREIGILGAGEGTVPAIKPFLDAIKVHGHDFIKRCKSTLKLGIRFENWRGDGQYYYHNFNVAPSQFILPERRIFNTVNESAYIDAHCYVNNIDLHKYAYSDQLCENLMLPFKKDDIKFGRPKNDFSAWHFDAVEVARFFEEIGTARGIKYVDDYVNSFTLDADGYINKINLQKGSVDCDFVFDCSGFKRLIIGQLYKSKWVDVKESLTVNKAIPFFLPPDKKLKNYTTATAMNNGWVWQIPLQHRTGCGYVFNSNFCDDETAKKELTEKFGDHIDIPKSFTFDAGHYENTWIKNCIAIGLSAGFVEPIEATSIWASTIGLTILSNSFAFLPKAPEPIMVQYNSHIRKLNENIEKFIQYHYFTERKDTEFWRDVGNRKILMKNSFMLDVWKYKIPSDIDTNFISSFHLNSWARVGFGNGFFDRKSIGKHLNILKEEYADIEFIKQKYAQEIDLYLQKNISHQEYLEFIVGKDQLEENRKLIFK